MKLKQGTTYAYAAYSSLAAMHFKVSTVLPMPAAEFFVERDSAAFRALVAHRYG